MNEITRISPTLHIRFDGQSIEVPMEVYDLGDMSTDAQIRAAAAEHLQVPEAKFNGYVVDKNPDSLDVTVRPPAVFG